MRTALLLASLVLAAPAHAQLTRAEQAPTRENTPTQSESQTPAVNALPAATEPQPAQSKNANSRLLRDLRVYPCF